MVDACYGEYRLEADTGFGMMQEQSAPVHEERSAEREERDSSAGGGKDVDGAGTGATNFLLYMKERDEAREELKTAERQVTAAKSRSYDLLKRVEELEEQLKKERAAKKAAGGNKAVNKTAATKPKKTKDKTLTREQKASKSPKKGTLHPILIGKEEVSENSKLFYQEIAERCPQAKLSVVIKAEKLFLEGDVNGDGLIVTDELDTLFTKHMALYTRQQTDDILKSVDTDGSNSLDFTETVEVLMDMENGDTNKLPANSVQKNTAGTAICSIQ